MGFKYIVLVSELFGEYPIIFPGFIAHTTGAQSFPGKPISVGSVEYVNGELRCSGESTSLRLHSWVKDNNLLNKLIRKG